MSFLVDPLRLTIQDHKNTAKLRTYVWQFRQVGEGGGGGGGGWNMPFLAGSHCHRQFILMFCSLIAAAAVTLTLTPPSLGSGVWGGGGGGGGTLQPYCSPLQSRKREEIKATSTSAPPLLTSSELANKGTSSWKSPLSSTRTWASFLGGKKVHIP